MPSEILYFDKTKYKNLNKTKLLYCLFEIQLAIDNLPITLKYCDFLLINDMQLFLYFFKS